MAMFRYTVQWLAGSGGAGTSTFHMSDSVGPALGTKVAAIRAFYAALANDLPTDVSISFPGEISEIAIDDGRLLGVAAVAAPAGVVGTDVGAYPAPVGGRVRWVTDAVISGRRVTGTTFIVPLRGAAYQSDGTLAPGTVTTLLNAANTLLGVMSFGMYVWHRPTAASPSSGAVASVLGAAIPDRAAVLRSRRD